MGKSDGLIIPTYKALLKPVPAVTWDIKNEGFRQERVSGTTALLGFSECSWVGGDCYDLSLKNWNINSEWELDKKYDRIISTRCPYFAKTQKTLLTGFMLISSQGEPFYWIGG